ncbi:MAG: hypothetical protein ACKOZU_07125 [Planctomycetaceae bacterium]
MKPASFGPRRPFWVGVPGLALAAVLGVCPQARAQGNTVNYMVIKAPATETIGEIKDKFELAKKSTQGNFNCDAVIIEPIKAETFGLLNAIVTRGADAVRQAKPGEEMRVIERLAGERDAWTVDLGGAALAETATIGVVGAGGAEESLEVQVGKTHERGLDFSFHSPGRYVVRSQPGVRPINFRCKAVDFGGSGSPKERDVSADFPPVDSGLTYLVTLNGVRGDPEFLFKALRNPAIVNNPIRQMGNVPLIVANFVPNEGDVIVDGVVILRFPVPQGESPKRLWLFLAPTNAARDAELGRLTAGKDTDDGYFKKIPERIRAKTSKTFLPGADGGWVELPATRNESFEGKVQVDVPTWQAALRAGGADVNEKLLLVYEGEYGDEQERRPIKVGGSYVVIKPYPEWLPAIRAAK